MRREDRVRIAHMIEAAETVAEFIDGRLRSDLDGDKMLRLALVRAIEVIGEAAGKVSANTREASAEIPWRLVVAMRNRLIHAYFDIDHDVLWKTATVEVPGLLEALRRLDSTSKSRQSARGFILGLHGFHPLRGLRHGLWSRLQSMAAL